MPEPDPERWSYLPQLLFLLALTLVNAYFSAAEIAIVSVSKARIKNLAAEGNKRARILQGLLEQPNRFLSTIQVVITLAGFLTSAVAATSMGEDVSVFFAGFGVPYAYQIAVVAITFILAFFNLVLGELYPKRMALLAPEKIALFSARPIQAISVIAAPFVWLLSKSVNILLKISGRDSLKAEDQYSEEEIKSLLEVGQETGQINESGKEMIASIFEFDDKLAYEIMTPRTDVYMININEPLSSYVDELLEEKYSRVPVYDKDVDDVIGVLYMKDFIIRARQYGFEKVHIRKILQKPYFVPESKNIDELFHEMQKTKTHVALLIDEYGGFSGMVTIEDIIEEIMGNIDDEYDDDEPKLEKTGTNTWLLDGGYYIDDLNEELGLAIESSEHETVGGFIIDRIGEIPVEDDSREYVVEEGDCAFRVESVKERRVDKILLTITMPEAAKGEEGIEATTAGEQNGR
ncbi:MAG: hemolysin family protein [Clostridiales Family XIII bacterium]|jgi:putative hemolysin|nr:hemolysin family protein [Clostridiales Family XIII bacterium]